MTNCRIFDDQYWERIYEKLSTLIPEYSYPIKNNIENPILFTDRIENWDIILLDNFFPWEQREEPIWNDFLQRYIVRWLKCKIICISDYWKVLLDKYMYWNLVNQKWDILWWITSKNAGEIANIIKPWQEKKELKSDFFSCIFSNNY